MTRVKITSIKQQTVVCDIGDVPIKMLQELLKANEDKAITDWSLGDMGNDEWETTELKVEEY